MATAVVVDSACNLPADLIERWGVNVVPLHVVTADEVRTEGVDVSAADVLAELEAGASLSTSQPSPAAFAEAYAAAARGGATEIVSVHMSGAASGTANTARLAAQDSPVRVEVIDTRTFTMAAGFAALAAAALAAGGASATACAAEARRVASTSV